MTIHTQTQFLGAPELTADLVSFKQVGSYGAQFLDLDVTQDSVSIAKQDCLYFCTFKNARRAHYRIDDRDLPREAFGAGECLVQPAGVSLQREFRTRSHSLGLLVPQTKVQDVLSGFDHSPDTAFDPLLARVFRSPLILTLMERLGAEVAQVSPHSALVSDALIQSMITELFTLGHRQPSQPTQARGSLPPSRLDRVQDYVRAHLADRLTPDNLAEQAKMSLPEFAAALKADQGVTPYQYILRCRLDEARGLITGTELSLSEIAFRCGFSSQSHMTNVFSQKSGVTPAALRYNAR